MIHNVPPTVMGVQFEYGEAGIVLTSISYLEEGDRHPKGSLGKTATFTNDMSEAIELAVGELQMEIIRLIDLFNDERRARPTSIPSRKAQAEDDD